MTDRFVSPAALPTPYEREIAVILLEEAAEVQQRITKLLRFGALETQPGGTMNNAQRLGFEVGDLLEMIDLCIRSGLIDSECVADGRKNKRAKLARFLQTASEAPR